MNDNVDRSHGKEGVRTNALDTLPGATSGDVHAGLGKPIQGSSDTSKTTSGAGSTGASGGSGLQGADDTSAESRRLQDDRAETGGAIKGHNQTLAGAEEVQGESAEFVAADSKKTGVHAAGSGPTKETSGVSNRGAGAPR